MPAEAGITMNNDSLPKILNGMQKAATPTPLISSLSLILGHPNTEFSLKKNIRTKRNSAKSVATAAPRRPKE
jgi:hypothetical protein